MGNTLNVAAERASSQFNPPCSQYFPFKCHSSSKHILQAPHREISNFVSVHAPYASCVPKIAQAPFLATPETNTHTQPDTQPHSTSSTDGMKASQYRLFG